MRTLIISQFCGIGCLWDGDKEHLSFYQLQKLAKKEASHAIANEIDDDYTFLLV